ncbi:MAG: nucleotidyltransferase domain-containing protein [Candidatus Hydrogenedentes bacterium]|nr:nucleotidyltransferase domain-containing protein [Candidatus Hydrogenedentota bacterium]
MTDQELIQAVKAIVLRFDPNARVILYGSRARGDSQPDSDWDFLVLLNEELPRTTQRDLEHQLNELELETGTIISMFFRTKRVWDSALLKATPFHAAVSREGVVV